MTCFGPCHSARRRWDSKMSYPGRRRKEMLKNQGGFTLVECLIAIFILSVALMGMAAFMGSLMKANLQSKQIQTASTVMEGKMEELKNIPSNLLTNGNDTVAEGSTTYTRTWTIASAGGNLKNINITVDIGSSGRTVTGDTVRN
jgi:prepilin-type N-terminal cleavage/methylation domain-containing protein